MSKKLMLNLEFEFLEKIANYYCFPVAVFLMQPKDFPKNKRRDLELVKKAECFDRIKHLIELDVKA